MPEISRSISRGILIGLVILVSGASAISFVSPRQAFLLADFFAAQTENIDIGSIVFVEENGAYEVVQPKDVCSGVSDFEAKYLVESFPNQKFEVSTAFSLPYWPWDSQVTFTLADLKTVQPSKLFVDLLNQTDGCEAEFGKRSQNRCVLVVSTIAKTHDGVNVVRLSGCQLIDTEEEYRIASEFGSGQKFKDHFGRVSKIERFWISIKENFVQISTGVYP